LILADRSLRKHFGLLKDLPVMINGVEVPTYFVVLDMEAEPKDPLILGRPYLASVGAMIDVKDGRISLNLGKHIKLQFDINETSQRTAVEEKIRAQPQPSDSITRPSTTSTLDLRDLKKKSDEQEETIEKLAQTVEELKSKLDQMQEKAQSRYGNDTIPMKKITSRWSGPFSVTAVRPYRAITLAGKNGDFTVNGQRLKKYMIDQFIPDGTSVPLEEPINA